MKVEQHEFGAEKNRLVIIDDFLPEAHRAVEIAARIAPFAPEESTAYPGLRHQLTPDQKEGAAYVRGVLNAAAPVINAMYGAGSLAILEASFSIVTRSAAALTPQQRLPHYDMANVNHIALLHHLHHLPDTGTAFYRHRRTGFEIVSAERRPALEQAWKQDRDEFGEPKGEFFNDTDARYERIYEVEARFNRMVIYQGALFHSGVIPQDFAFDPSPRSGRLTGTIFVMANPPGVARGS